MTQALPVAFYLNDVDGETARRGIGGHPGGSSDVATRIADAHARGVLEARASAQVELDAAIARERAAQEQMVVAERQRWAAAEAGRLADLLAAGLGNVERRVAEQVARILKPMLAGHVRARAVDQLAMHLNDLLSKGESVSISISGPQDLVSVLQTRLPSDANGVVVTPSEAPDLIVTIDETILEARLGAWAQAIGEDVA